MNFTICDDDIVFAQYLKDALIRLCAIHGFTAGEIPVFCRPKVMLNAVTIRDDDVFFLDIEMPEMTGFDVMKELCDSGKRIFVIFVSSHENYVHNAWDYHPYSFISKANLDYKLERNLLDIHKEYISRHKTVLLNTEKGFYSLDLKNLEYAEVDRNNLILHLIEGDSVEIRETISRIADEWTVYGIVRAHKSYLVNVQYIFSLENKTLRLQSGAIVDVSRKCREDLQKAYREWMRYEQ